MPNGRAAIRFRKDMSRLAGEPVAITGRVNIAGLTVFRGAALVIWAGSCIWSFATSAHLVYLGTIVSLAVEHLAWAVLRRRGGALRFGAAGGVIGVSPTTLYAAQVNYLTGGATRLTGRWPRDQVLMTPVPGQSRSPRRFDLLFPTASATSHLELVQNGGKSATLRALFGSDSRELTVAPAAGRPWGPGWTTPKDE